MKLSTNASPIFGDASGTSLTLSTPLAITSGGTGASTAQTAINNLTSVPSTDGWVLTYDSASGNALFKATTGGYWTESGSLDYLTTTSNKLAIGRTSLISTEKVVIDGSTDIIQTIIRGNATQTASIFEVRKSDNSVLLGVTNASGVIVGGTTSQIKDTSDKVLVQFQPSGSAVNYVTVWNAATGNGPIITAGGGDANVALVLRGLGISGIHTANALREAVVSLSDVANPALDSSLGNIFTLTATGNRLIGIPSNPPPAGVTQKIIIEHTASGAARTLGLSGTTGGFNFGTDITSLTATASGLTDHIGCVYNHARNEWDIVAVSKGY